ARRRDGLGAGVALPRGRAPRRVPRRAPPLRGADPRPLPRRTRAVGAPLRPRRGRRCAPLPVGGELGVHVAAAGPRHGRARRPVLRAARRRDQGLLDPGVSQPPYGTGSEGAKREYATAVSLVSSSTLAP